MTHAKIHFSRKKFVSPYELLIGLRYTRAKKRNHFISFISLISLLGITLGMTVLITVMSVMNGFHKEIRSRILGVASHVQISSINGILTNWQQVADTASKHPQVIAAAPYVNAQGMLSHNQVVRGIMVRGILPDAENHVADFAQMMVMGKLTQLAAGEFGIVIGVDRGVGRDALRALGADVIVDELDELIPAVERAAAASADSPTTPSTREDPA